MKLEDQVCTRDQAEKLKELGIIQDAFHLWELDGDIWCLSHYIPFSRVIPQADQWFAAFTVGELGMMLPDEYLTLKTKMDHHGNGPIEPVFHAIKEDDFHIEILHFKGGPGYYRSEAQARAAILIHLVENGHLIAEDVNKGLTG